MKREKGTLRTKQAIAESLKKLMQKKPLSKITVNEIITDCDINRNTFYYHFENIYDLLKWMLSQEIMHIDQSFHILTDYEEAIRFVIHYIQNNAHILNCAYDSLGRDELKRYLQDDFLGAFYKLVSECEQQNQFTLTDSFRDFICHFMAESIASAIISGFKDKNPPDEDELVQNISVLILSLPDMLKKAEAYCR